MTLSLSSRAQRGTFDGTRVGKVGPDRIRCLDQGVLFRPPPALDLFLPGDRLVDVLELLDMNQRVDSIFPSKGAALSVAMIGNPLLKVVSHTNVHHVPLDVRKNVNVVSVHRPCLSSVSLR